MSIKRGSEIHRLKIIKGHLEKVIDMVEQETNCLNTMYQLEAVISALKKTQGMLMENYVRNCLKTNIRDIPKGKELQKQIIDLFIGY